MEDHNFSEIVKKSLTLAEELQRKAMVVMTSTERKQMNRLSMMVTEPQNKNIVTLITDQSFRSQKSSRSVDQLIHILKKEGIPSFFPLPHHLFFRLFIWLGKLFSQAFLPLIQGGLYLETKQVIAPGETPLLKQSLIRLHKEQVRVNLNSLGEMLLGEKEAENRLASYIQLLEMPEVEVISVKISTLYSQISLIARESTLENLIPRLKTLYQHAQKNYFIRPDGSRIPKFVYLDMEEYHHLHITVDLFIQTLDLPSLENYGGGIVLQAYIPESYSIQKQITAWARKRIMAGKSAITLRVVKGANLEMERVFSSIAGYPLPMFKEKKQTDANYKRMLQFAFTSENIKAVKIGVASHNLFEIAYALVLAEENRVLSGVQFEMLEGMTNHQKRALLPYAKNMLLYVPSVPRSGFLNAIGYLIRRLDENSGEENFLRHTFGLQPRDKAWQKLTQTFTDSFSLIPTLTEHPRRIQNRNLKIEGKTTPTGLKYFDNEPDTDFSLLENITWVESLIKKWKTFFEKPFSVPLQISGQDIFPEAWGDRKILTMDDPSQPGKTVTKFPLPTSEDIEEAIACAEGDPSQWRKKSYSERYSILQRVAQEVRKARGDLIGVAMAECGKIITQTDTEVSEAIDFIDFYIRSAEYWETQPGLKAEPLGTILVIPPWNFPIAIPCGGIAAALSTGNTVILKPSPQSTLCARFLCECYWRAGVPKTTLQFLPGDASIGSLLTGDPRIQSVIFTGGTATAHAILRQNPRTHLLAETGGKNAIIVTALADREQAVKNVVYSAFGHGGQKCSAASLLILEREVYEDENFKKTLIDATHSLAVDSAWKLHTKINPLIRKPNADLSYGLGISEPPEPEEEWVLKPEMVNGNPQLWSPGIRWGVKPGSRSHLTEFFGPVLSVLCSENLHQAISLVNETGYGLTSGIETLDEREKEVWVKEIRAGNLYINRGITGAIVLRQPFGGIGKSAFGPGIKAGGPNYTYQFYRFTETKIVQDFSSDKLPHPFHRLEEYLSKKESHRLSAYIKDIKKNLAEEFLIPHDHFQLVGEDNFRIYRPVDHIIIRLHPTDNREGILIRIITTNLVGCETLISYPLDYPEEEINFLKHTLSLSLIQFKSETDEELAEGIRDRQKKNQVNRIRYDGWKIPENILLAGAENYSYIAGAPVTGKARLELLWYFYEQSLSHDYHRYGNLGKRSGEKRREVL